MISFFLIQNILFYYIILVILMCGDTTMAEHVYRPEKGKEVEFHHHTFITHWTHNITEMKPSMQKWEKIGAQLASPAL